MQGFSLYRVHKVLARTDGRTEPRIHGTTAALLYPHRNALRGDKNKIQNSLRYVCVSKKSTTKQKKKNGNIEIRISRLNVVHIYTKCNHKQIKSVFHNLIVKYANKTFKYILFHASKQEQGQIVTMYNQAHYHKGRRRTREKSKKQSSNKVRHKSHHLLSDNHIRCGWPKYRNNQQKIKPSHM